MKYVDANGVTRWLGKWRGVATSTDDEDRRQGLVRVLVPDVLGGTESALARPCLPYGDFRVPEPGTQVWVEFEQGNPDFPVVVGWLPSTKDGAKPAPPTMIALDDETTAFGIGKGGGAVTVPDPDAPGGEREITEPVTNAQSKYPYVRGIRVGQTYVEVDGTPGQERVHIYHRAGAYYEIGSSGQVRMLARGKQTDWVKGARARVTTGALTEVVEGSATFDVKRSRELRVGGNDAVSVARNAARTVGGSATESVGGSFTQEVGGLAKRTAGGLDEKVLGNANRFVAGAEAVVVAGADLKSVGNKDFLLGQTIGYGRTVALGDIEFSAKTGQVTVKSALATLNLGILGDFSVKGPLGTLSMDPAGRFKLAGVTGELLDLLDQLLTALISSVTATALGPQPLSGVPQFTLIKGLLAGIKG